MPLSRRTRSTLRRARRTALHWLGLPLRMAAACLFL